MATHSRLGRTRLAILVVAIAIGAAMITAGQVLATQTQLHVYQTDQSPTNFTLPPQGSKFWFGEGNNGGGLRHIIYFVITSPSNANAELQVTAMGAVNDTIFTASSPYSQAEFTIPAGTKMVNYSIYNAGTTTIQVLGAEVIFSKVEHPNLWLGDSLLYLGVAVVAASLAIGVVLGRLSLRRTKVP
jgi:hypothetical protein